MLQKLWTSAFTHILNCVCFVCASTAPLASTAHKSTCKSFISFAYLLAVNSNTMTGLFHTVALRRRTFTIILLIIKRRYISVSYQATVSSGHLLYHVLKYLWRKHRTRQQYMSWFVCYTVNWLHPVCVGAVSSTVSHDEIVGPSHKWTKITCTHLDINTLSCSLLCRFLIEKSSLCFIISISPACDCSPNLYVGENNTDLWVGC